MSIASEISRLLQAKANIKIAIEGKGVTVSGTATLDDYSDLIDAIQQGSEPNLQSKSVEITENGTTTVEADTGFDGLSDVTVSVNVPTGGGGGGLSSGDDVRFIDYDGTILHSYSASGFLELTEMPENPTHTGLTSQGWNWSLADAKAQVQALGSCDIGQMYITESGKTEIDVHFSDAARLSPNLTIAVNGTVTVDWGDNSTVDTVTGSSATTSLTVPHTYANEGDYTIKITLVSGNFMFYGSKTNILLRKSTSLDESVVYSNTVRSVRFGNGVTGIGSYAFYCCYSISSVTIPSGVTSIGDNAFNSCYSLASITIPSGVKNIWNNTFQNCYSLVSVTMPSSVKNIASNAFQSCYSLASVTMPSAVTSIGSSAFQSCYSLASVTMSSAVTSIGSSAFFYCYSLASVTIPSGVTSISNSTFYYCYSLVSVTMPSSVKSIGSSAFQNCFSLASVAMPSSVTSIGSSAFQDCHSLASVTIPSRVTSIGNNAFRYCYGMAEYHLLPTTPPTLGGTSVFDSIASDCVIYVPVESLSSYQSASRWSSHASKMVGE